MTTKENPPAFPSQLTQLEFESGMTLLDYFAGQALQGMMFNTKYFGATSTLMVSGSYGIAKLMLEERKKYLQT